MSFSKSGTKILLFYNLQKLLIQILFLKKITRFRYVDFVESNRIKKGTQLSPQILF